MLHLISDITKPARSKFEDARRQFVFRREFKEDIYIIQPVRDYMSDEEVKLLAYRDAYALAHGEAEQERLNAGRK